MLIDTALQARWAAFEQRWQERATARETRRGHRTDIQTHRQTDRYRHGVSPYDVITREISQQVRRQEWVMGSVRTLPLC